MNDSVDGIIEITGSRVRAGERTNKRPIRSPQEHANEKTAGERTARGSRGRGGTLSEMRHCASAAAGASRGYYRDNISYGAAQNAQLDMKSARKKRRTSPAGRGKKTTKRG